jgi:hypothetical protein
MPRPHLNKKGKRPHLREMRPLPLLIYLNLDSARAFIRPGQRLPHLEQRPLPAALPRRHCRLLA